MTTGLSRPVAAQSAISRHGCSGLLPRRSESGATRGAPLTSRTGCSYQRHLPSSLPPIHWTRIALLQEPAWRSQRQAAQPSRRFSARELWPFDCASNASAAPASRCPTFVGADAGAACISFSRSLHRYRSNGQRRSLHENAACTGHMATAAARMAASQAFIPARGTYHPTRARPLAQIRDFT